MTSTLLFACVTAAFWLLGGMTSLLGAVYGVDHWWPLASNGTDPAQMPGRTSSCAKRYDDADGRQLAAPVMMILLLVISVLRWWARLRRSLTSIRSHTR